VQNVINLDGGKSALKLTTASYHRPSGKNIHRFPNSKEEDEWGVMPNDGYLLKYSPAEMEQYLDYRRDRDVVREGDEKGAIDFDDKQLGKAVAYLTEQLAAPPSQKPADVDANKGEDKTEKKDEKAGEAPKGGASIEFYRRIPWRPGFSG
jgi:carboxyl-terminal processing protease